MRKSLINKRKAKRFTQKVMADKLNISLSFYVKIEQGKRNPNLGLAQKIAEILETTVEEIFFKPKRHDECPVQVCTR